MKQQNMRRRAIVTIAGLGAIGLAALAGCGGGGDGFSVLPTPTPPASGVRTVTVISTSGTFSRATGQYTQTSGSFDRLRGTLLPPAAPNPTEEPATPPDPSSGVMIYSGTYTLSSGEAGEFIFTSLANATAEGVGVPPELLRFQGSPEMVGSGEATVTLRISGSTGSGTIQLSNNDRGTVTITSSTGTTAQVRAIMKRLATMRAVRTRALRP